MSVPTTIFDNGDLSYFVELEPTFWDQQTGYTLAIYSRLASAKKPMEAQQKFLACLDREGLEKLRQLITDQLAKYQQEYSLQERQGLKRMGNFTRGLASAFRNGADL